MIAKKELLNLFENAMKTEEATIPLYTEHINSTLFMSNFDEGKQERIRQILQQLHDDSSRHARTFQLLIQKVEKEDKDVF